MFPIGTFLVFPFESRPLAAKGIYSKKICAYLSPLLVVSIFIRIAKRMIVVMEYRSIGLNQILFKKSVVAIVLVMVYAKTIGVLKGPMTGRFTKQGITFYQIRVHLM